MRRLIVNILLFFISIFLLLTIGLYGLFYTLYSSIKRYKNNSFIKYWADLFYSINVGIDKIGNVLLAAFLNRYAIKKNIYKFGNVNHTISHVLAINYFNKNLKPLGKFLVKVLEKIDPGHMEDSIKKYEVSN